MRSVAPGNASAWVLLPVDPHGPPAADEGHPAWFEGSGSGTVRVMTRRSGRTRPVVAALVLLGCGVVGLVGCAPPPNDEARRRVRVLTQDRIKTVRPPGGRLLRHSRDAGHEMSPGGQADPTVVWVYSFSGDTRAAALSVAGQIRQAGWTLTTRCDTTTGSFSMGGGKRFDKFDAGLGASVEVTPASPASDGLPARNAAPQVTIILTTPYPYEYASGTTTEPSPSEPLPSEPDCLLDPPR